MGEIRKLDIMGIKLELDETSMALLNNVERRTYRRLAEYEGVNPRLEGGALDAKSYIH
jgi:hypothetical protein